jgi:hypothetical protein
VVFLHWGKESAIHYIDHNVFISNQLSWKLMDKTWFAERGMKIALSEYHEIKMPFGGGEQGKV